MTAIFLSILISTTLLSGIFFIIWLKTDRKPHILCWALAYFFAVVNILLNASRDLFPDRDIYWIIVNTTSYLLQFSAGAGFFYRARINPFRFRFISFFIVMEALLITLTLYDIHYGLKVGLSPLSGVVTHWAILWAVYSVDRPLRVAEKGLIVVYALFSLTQFSAGIAAIMQGYVRDEYFLGIYREINFLFLGPAFIGTGMFAIMIIADDLSTKIKRQLLQIKNTNQQLEKEKIKAEQATKAKSRFLANMSHEIRTPMNAVLGMSYLTLKTPLTPIQKDYVENIQHSAEGLLSIISDVLTLSKIEAEATELIEESFSLPVLVHTCIEPLSILAQKKNLKIDYEITGSMPKYVLADKGKLKQILINLLGNAIKFTKQGSIKLKCKHQLINQQRLIHFEVHDTGIGIAPENLSNVCQAFTQIDDSRTRSFEGTGLGLKISHQLIDLMGGELKLSSEVEVGSCFSFTLPFNVGEMNSQHSNDNKRTDLTTDKIYNANVLIADDHQTNRLLLTELLKQVGMSVTEADNGLAAFELCQTEAFDLIILDVHMPQLDGYQTTQKIRQLAQYQTTPIIAITANAFDTDRADALASGMTEHISKPIKPAHLYKKLASWCDIPPVLENRNNSEQQSSHQKLLSRPLHIQHNHYQQMLRAFIEDHQNDIALLQTAITETNLPLWKQVLHGLLGCTGNIGATKLYSELVQLNERTKAHVPDFISEQLIELFAVTITEINTLIESVDKSLTPVTTASKQALNLMITDLIALIQTNSFNFHEPLKQLTHNLPAELEKDALELQQKLEAFDFESAVKVCIKLRQLLSDDSH